VAAAAALSLAALPAPALAASRPATSHIAIHVTPTTVHVGAVFTVTGATSPRIKGATVVLERRVGTTWRVLAHAKTGTTGLYSVNVRAPKQAAGWALRVTRAGSRTAKPGVSGVARVTVTKAMYAVTAAAPATNSSAQPILVSGTVKPAATGGVEVQLLKGKTWHNLLAAKLTKASTFAVATLRPAGPYRLRVVKAFSAKVAGGVSKAFTVTVTAPVTVTVAPPSITTLTLTGGMASRPYSQALAATGGASPYSWSATGLPAGLTISSAGVIAGKPSLAGTSAVSVTVKDSGGRTASASLPLVIAVTSGTVMTWGANSSGQLGNNTTVNSDVPVTTGLTMVTAAASGTYANYALRTDGTVWSWGLDSNGQLGTGTPLADSHVPVQIPGLSGVTSLAAGTASVYALKADGTVWAWGAGDSGQLGDNTRNDSSVPVQVSGLTGVTAITASDANGFALKSDGAVWAWGEGSGGELGNGASLVDALVPAQIAGLSHVTAIAGAAESAYALAAGTVMSWGDNTYGQLGNGTTTASRVPIAIAELTGVTALSASYFDGYALHSDGSLSAWGVNNHGELGNGILTSTLVPVAVPGLTAVTAVEGRGSDASALRADGSVLTWGYNGFGGLGNGSTVDASTPVVVPGLSNVVGLAIGSVSIDGLAIVAP
jgi:alpha-tubulin suppressor-like RCC1 family protein